MTATIAQQLQTECGISKEIALKYPVRLATGDLLEKITVRRTRVGDLRAVTHIASEAEQGLAIIARVTGLIPEDLDMLDLEDLEALQNCFRPSQEN